MAKMWIGDKKNYLTMISEPYFMSKHYPAAMFRCDCGRTKQIGYKNVSEGSTKSCGCKYKELHKNNHSGLTHGGYGTRLYNIYHKMLTRCYDSKYKERGYYSERGITVCNEWKNSFETFRSWALSNGYDDNLSIDRIDNSKGYSPENCRWATPATQNRNKRNNINITYNGKTQCLKDWCDEFSLPYSAVQRRIRTYKWDEIKAITTPIRRDMV